MSYYEQDPIMQFFAYQHLPESLQTISKPFGLLAEQLCDNLPSNLQRTETLKNY